MRLTAAAGRRVSGCDGFGRVVVQPRPQPALDFLQRHAFAEMIIKKLVATEFADGEIPGFRMREIKAAYRAARPHGETLGQLDAGALFHVEQIPEGSLFRVIRTRRITRRRPDAAVFFRDQILGGQFFKFAKTPFFANALVQEFRERFRQPVRQRLGHDGVVIVVVGLEFVHQFL